LLRASEKSAEGRWIEVEGSSDFRIAEVVAAKEQELSLAGVEDTEDLTDTILFLVRGVDFFRRGCAAYESDQSFVPCASCLAAKFVEAQADSGAVEPRFGSRSVDLGLAPEFHEGFHGEFFGSGRVADDSGDDTGYAIELGTEQGLEVE